MILNRYKPLGRAGDGGFGVVIAAFDTNLQRRVAIKAIQLSPENAAKLSESLGGCAGSAGNEEQGETQIGARVDAQVDAQAGARADTRAGVKLGVPSDAKTDTRAEILIPGLSEARLAGNMGSSHIVQVYDLQLEGTTAYLIMEYVDGMSLSQFLKLFDDELTLDMMAAVLRDVADALRVAHKNKVLHLDIKPDNILINSEGVVKVTDFGMAALPDASGATHAQGGTIGYMPPEQMRKENLDERCDEWALAVVIYVMLAGENPFKAKNIKESLRATKNAELTAPSVFWDALDDDADDVMFYALSPNREDRYESVRDFASQMVPLLGKPKRGEKQLAELIEKARLMSSASKNGGTFAEGTSGGNASRELYGEGALDDTLDGTLDDTLNEDVFDENTFGGSAFKAGAKTSTEQKKDGQGYENENPDDGGDINSEGLAGGNILERMRLAIAKHATSRSANVLARILSTISTAFMCAVAAMNFSESGALAFSAQINSIVPWVVVAICSVATYVVPSVGALCAYSALSISLVACKHPLPGIVLLLGTVCWWVFATRPHAHTKAPSNVSLCVPVAGIIGATPIASFAAGYYLKAGKSAATAAHCFLVALVLGSLKTHSLFAWHPFSGAMFYADNLYITDNFIYMITNPAILCIGVSWVAGAVVFSVCCSKKKRWLGVIGAISAGIIEVFGLFCAQSFHTIGYVSNSFSVLDFLPPAAQIAMVAVCSLFAAVCCYIYVPKPKD